MAAFFRPVSAPERVPDILDFFTAGVETIVTRRKLIKILAVERWRGGNDDREEYDGGDGMGKKRVET